MNWISLTDLGQLNDIMDTSFSKTTLIFKHSTRCSVSRMALRLFENECDIEPALIDAYFLDLLNYRAISTEIAAKFNVEHQSPQLIVVKNGEVVYQASHSEIDVAELKKQVA